MNRRKFLCLLQYRPLRNKVKHHLLGANRLGFRTEGLGFTVWCSQGIRVYSIGMGILLTRSQLTTSKVKGPNIRSAKLNLRINTPTPS